MTPQLIAAIVACLMGIAGLVGAITAWVKAKTSTEQIKAERLRTKESRDSEAKELRDQILKNTWEICQLKDNAKHNETLVDDLRNQISSVNTELARALVKLDEIAKAILELKQ